MKEKKKPAQEMLQQLAQVISQKKAHLKVYLVLVLLYQKQVEMRTELFGLVKVRVHPNKKVVSNPAKYIK